MQIFALLVWLALCFLIAKLVNFFAKRPAMNPWKWFAGSYAVLYIFGLVIGAVRGNPNLAYVAGSFFPITAIAVVLGIWRAPKWQDAQAVNQPEQSQQG
jgi:heme A synthase